MPHKHKRKRDEDETNFDLPPTTRARPLPSLAATKQESIFTSDKETKAKAQQKKIASKRKSKPNGFADDDTPKAFARLMAFQQGKKIRPSAGLDDGTPKSKKKDKNKPKPSTTTTTTNTTTNTNTDTNTSAPTTTSTTNLKILPGEKLSEFSARVDQSLPLTSIPKPSTGRLTKIPGLENLKAAQLTKHNKRLARLQSEWRATEEKLRLKREEEAEELADKVEEDELVWLGAGIDKNAGVAGKKGKKKKGKKADADDVDPWKQLERKRAEEGTLGRPASLQDVVLAPPVLKPVRNIFKEKSERKTPLVHT
ncbi:hypothetical protein ABEF95_009397 [Exophiala dermatitidis]